jgi:hypothetical protein
MEEKNFTTEEVVVLLKSHLDSDEGKEQYFFYNT